MLIDLEREPRSVKAQKKPIPVSVVFATNDGEMLTLEGVVKYRKGDALLTGVKGESWPMERLKFDNYYEPYREERDGFKSLYVKRDQLVWALRLEKEFSINLSNERGILRGMPGDWLVQYSPGDVAVVNASIFEASYEVSQKEL